MGDNYDIFIIVSQILYFVLGALFWASRTFTTSRIWKKIVELGLFAFGYRITFVMIARRWHSCYKDTLVHLKKKE